MESQDRGPNIPGAANGFWRADPVTFGLLPSSVIYSICFTDWFFLPSVTRHKDERVGSLFHPRPLNLHIPLLFKLPFHLPPLSREWIQWVNVTSRPSAINSNGCNISSSTTAILWLLYIIFILLGSVSLVTPESARGQNYISRLWYFHTHYRTASQERLSFSLAHSDWSFSRAQRVTQCSLVTFQENDDKFSNTDYML